MKNNKIIIVFLVILIILIGYFIFFNNKTKYINSPKNYSGDIILKEYKNDQLGISFSYPEEWGNFQDKIELDEVGFQYNITIPPLKSGLRKLEITGLSNPYSSAGRGTGEIDLKEIDMVGFEVCDTSNNQKIMTKNNIEGIFAYTVIAMYDSCSEHYSRGSPKEYYAVFDTETKLQNVVITGNPLEITKEEFIKIINSMTIY